MNLAKTCRSSFTFCIMRWNKKDNTISTKPSLTCFLLHIPCVAVQQKLAYWWLRDLKFLFSSQGISGLRLFHTECGWDDAQHHLFYSVTTLLERIVTLKRHGENLSFDKAQVSALPKSSQEDTKTTILAVWKFVNHLENQFKHEKKLRIVDWVRKRKKTSWQFVLWQSTNLGFAQECTGGHQNIYFENFLNF